MARTTPFSDQLKSEPRCGKTLGRQPIQGKRSDFYRRTESRYRAFITQRFGDAFLRYTGPRAQIEHWPWYSQCRFRDRVWPGIFRRQAGIAVLEIADEPEGFACSIVQRHFHGEIVVIRKDLPK